MLPSNETSNLSEFGQAAVALDGELFHFISLSGELERLSIESDKGLEKALAVMEEIGSCRERVEASMRSMARALSEVQARHEASERVVAARGAVVEERRQKAESLLVRFKALGEMVSRINAMVMQFRDESSGELSPELRTNLMSRLPEFDSHMDVVVNEARKIVDEAHSSNMGSLERNADALRKSLSSARNRIHLLAERYLTPVQ